MPKDLWRVKAILGGGTDSAIFKDRVKDLWGKYPLELYAGTEGGVYAMQTWDYEGMTFVPNLNFLEFIPEEEHFKWQIDEVQADKNYEIVITNFHGGSLVRFRIGDMIRITSLRNEKLDIDIPQMVFYGRADDIIDVTGLGRLNGMLIWQAIENTGIPYVDWTARREVIGNRAMLHLYVELKDGYISGEEAMAVAVGEELKKLNKQYHYNPYSLLGDFESIVGIKPIEVTVLPQGAFDSYLSQRQVEGVGMGYLKPPHTNPSDKVLSVLRAESVSVSEGEVTSAR
jgi:phenylacetate-coenzyme A ligase PaaK-like adenylate-forming protein